MGRVISIAAQKGGVGKTTAALNLGYCLSKLGGRVLILDCDPQGGLAVASNLKKRTSLGLLDVLKGMAGPADIIMQTRDSSLSIAGIGQPSPEESFMLERAALDGRFAGAVRSLASGYDYAILDTPAGLGGISASALGASDAAILVVTCRALTLKTMPGFLRLMEWVRENTNPELVLEGVLINMRAPGADEDEVCRELKETLPSEAFFGTEIPRDDSIETASLRSIPVAMLMGGGAASRAFTELALDLKEREYRRRLSEGAKGEDGADQGLF